MLLNTQLAGDTCSPTGTTVGTAPETSIERLVAAATEATEAFVSTEQHPVSGMFAKRRFELADVGHSVTRAAAQDGAPGRRLKKGARAKLRTTGQINSEGVAAVTFALLPLLSDSVETQAEAETLDVESTGIKILVQLRYRLRDGVWTFAGGSFATSTAPSRGTSITRASLRRAGKSPLQLVLGLWLAPAPAGA